MSYSTYAFEDLTGVFRHPSIGQFDIQGAGTGSITFSMANDTSAQDVAADGSVMTSKIKSGNGTIVIAAQQTSELHKWLLRAHNYLNSAPSREWAQMEMLAVAPSMQVEHEASNISIQKRADKPYQQQGQQVSWTLMAGLLEER